MKLLSCSQCGHLGRALARIEDKVMMQARGASIANDANLTGGENVGGLPLLRAARTPGPFGAPSAATTAPSATNEANLTGSENAGGSTVAPAAPEVADDDDDAESDEETEPRRRRGRREKSRDNELPPSLLRPKHVCALLKIGRTKLHTLSEADPRFPRKIVLGPRCVGWRREAIEAYLIRCESEA